MMLSPPSAKNESSTPTDSTPSTSANNAASTRSRSDTGARYSDASTCGSGNPRRSNFPDDVTGNDSSTTHTRGTMYSGNRCPNTDSNTAVSTTAPTAGTTYPTRRSADTNTADCATDGTSNNAASISPNSIRKPRTFTWKSVRPKYSNSPTADHRTRSPVRYNRSPPPDTGNGLATKRSAVNSGRATYPRANCTPARYNSPATPTGTGRNRPSSTNTRVFHTGAPIGTDTTSAAVTSWNVTSTAASVGPYKLCNRTCGNTSRNPAATCAGNASPDANTCRNDTADTTDDSATNTANIDGTKCIVDTDCSTIVRTRYSGSRCPSGTAITTRAPTCNGQNNSHTDTSNVNGVFCNTTSDPSSPYASCIHTRRLTIARCSTPTPFGRPVEPDVKITYAVLPGNNTDTRSASVTGASENPDTSTESTDTTPRPATSTPSPEAVNTTTGSAVSRMYSTRSAG